MTAGNARTNPEASQAPPPRPLRHVLGPDLGQRQGPTALAVDEVAERHRVHGCGWELVHHIRHLRRWELGTPYPRVVSDVAALVRNPALRDPLRVADTTDVGGELLDKLQQHFLDIEVLLLTINGETATEIWESGPCQR